MEREQRLVREQLSGCKDALHELRVTHAILDRIERQVTLPAYGFRHPSKLAYEANLREALRHLERARESLLEAASHLEQA